MYLQRALLILIVVTLSYMFEQHDYKLNQEYGVLNFYNKTFFSYFNFSNVKPNRTYKAFSVNLKLLRALGGDKYKINVRALKIVNNIPKIPIANFDIKVCDALKQNTFGMGDVLKRSGNITQCPIRKGYYYLQNFMIDDSLLPPYVPAGRYDIEATFFLDKAKLLHLHFVAEIVYNVKY